MDSHNAGRTAAHSARTDVLDVLMTHRRAELESTRSGLARAEGAAVGLLAATVGLAGFVATVLDRVPKFPTSLTVLVGAALAASGLATLAAGIGKPEQPDAVREQRSREERVKEVRKALGDVRDSDDPIVVRTRVLAVLEALESELVAPRRYKEKCVGIALIALVIAGFLFAGYFAIA